MSLEKTLEVQESPVKFGGRARVNKKVMEELGIEEGDLAVISSENKDVLVSIYYDNIIEEGKIKLRKEDRLKLDVSDGEFVSIREHKSILNKLL